MHPSLRTAPRGVPSFSTLCTLVLLALCLGVAVPGFAGDRSWSRADRPSADAIQRPADDPVRLLAERLALDGTLADKGTANDPIGDTFGTLTPQLDITELIADVVTDIPILFFRFSGPISPGDSGAPNAAVGYVDLDVDQNGATGEVPFTDTFNPAGALSGMGNEFYIDLFSYSSSDDAADVRDAATNTVVGRTPVLYAGSRMAIIVDPSLIGDDDGAVDVAAVLGTVPEPTDVVPNDGSLPSDTSTLLQGVRFRISVDWRRVPNFPTFRPARISDFRTGQSANLYFINPANLEFLIKVLDGCTNNNRYWVFFAGTTNVEFVLRVEDLASGQVNFYSNPQGNPADTVLDTQAFATCP